MKTIEISVTIGLSGCKRTKRFEIEDEATDDDIDEAAREVVLSSIVEWSWAVVDAPVKKPARRSR